MFVFEFKLTLAEAITIVLSILGGGFALYQWYKNSCLRRASYYNDAYTQLRNDPDIVTVIYTIDYGIEQWYPFQLYDESNKFEGKVDKAFSYFDYLCYLKKRRLIGKKEFGNIEYRLARIGHNNSSLDYLYNLYHFSQKNGTRMSFSYLLEYLNKKDFLDPEFWNPESREYVHFLNF